MKSKMTTNSQLSTAESKQQKQIKQTTRIGTESQKWRSHGGLSAGRGGENGGKVQGVRSTIGRHKNRQGDVKNSIGNEEAKEFICTTHGHEVRGRFLEGMGLAGGGGQRKNGTTV